MSSSREDGSLRLSVVRGRIFNMDITSHNKVLNDSSSNWLPCCSRRTFKTLRVLLIIRSHTTAMLLAVGTLNLNSKSYWCCWRNSCTTWSSIDSIDSFSSLLAPTKLVLQSHLEILRGPRMLINLLNKLMNESVVRVLTTSKCTALDAIQVERTP